MRLLSSKLSRQYHSVNFVKGDEVRNTWDDWFLIPKSRPLINPPKPKFNFVDIPGCHSSIDLTEVVSNSVPLSDRTGSLEFIVANSTCVGFDINEKSWFVRYEELLSFLNGQSVKLYLDDEPNVIYEGRFEVSNWNSDPNDGYSSVTLEYTIKPFPLVSEG